MNDPDFNYAKEIETIKSLSEGTHHFKSDGSHFSDCPGCRARRIKNQVIRSLGATDDQLLKIPNE